MKRIDNAWQFTPIWSEEFSHGENEYEEIRIPHTVKECPLHYIDVDSYQNDLWISKTLEYSRFK